MTKATAPSCRLCGSSHVEPRGHKPGQFIRREFEFFRCRECGFLFVEPFSGFEIYNEAYYRGEGPDPYVDYENEYRHWQRTDRMLEFEDLFRVAGELVPAAPAQPSAPLRWLDFGCGAGAFLKFLRARAALHGRPLELTGHDVGEYAERLKREDGFRIVDLDELSSEPAERYDVISMVEVIEHLPEPSAPIALIARLLKPGGILLLTTGNLDCRVARRQGIHYRYCMPEIHVSLFTPRSLTWLYRQHGLQPRQVQLHGAIKFKVLKSLRHRPALRAAAKLALGFPPVVRLIDHFYGVSLMPCAVKAPGPFSP